MCLGHRQFMYNQGHNTSSSSSSIPLPPGMSPGAIIGKGGSKIKPIQSCSGARVSVDIRTGCVKVSGSPSAVEEAVRLLLEQIDTFKATGVPRCAIEKPLQ